GRPVAVVVQEALTNPRKQPPGQPASVTLAGAPGAGLEVSVVNQLGPAAGPGGSPGPGRPPAPVGPRGPVGPLGPVGTALVPGTGTGLIGLSERLELAGGKLDWRNSAGGGRAL